MPINIRGYSEFNNRIIFSDFDDKYSKKGFATHCRFGYLLLKLIFGKNERCQKLRIAENRIIYINVKSFNNWINANKDLLKDSSNSFSTIQERFDIIKKDLLKIGDLLSQKAYGYDPLSKIYYKIIKNKDNSWDEIIYKKSSEIGRGGCGAVFLLKPQQKERNGKKLKFKVLKIESFNRRNLKYIKKLNIKNYSLLGIENTHINKIHEDVNNPVGIQLPFKLFSPSDGKKQKAMAIMKKYDGTLENQIKHMDLNEKKKAMGQLLLGLKTIHEQNLVHRDIKLDNIFYRRRDGEFYYYHADFGLSILNDAPNPKKQSQDIKDLRKAFALMYGGSAFLDKLRKSKGAIGKKGKDPLAQFLYDPCWKRQLKIEDYATPGLKIAEIVEAFKNQVGEQYLPKEKK